MTSVPSTTDPTLTVPDTPSRTRRAALAVATRLERLTLPQLTIASWLSMLAMCLLLLGASRTSIAGSMNIVENWGAVERVALWQDWLEPVIPRYELPTGVIAWGFRAAMVLAFATQAGAFLAALRQPNPSLWRWLIGPLGAHVIVFFLLVPSNSDVFFYETVGDLAAKGYNPYVHTLMDFPDHPLIPYNFWIDIGTVYGPLWVQFCRMTMIISGNDPIIATLFQKLVTGVVTFALIFFVYWFAKRLSGSRKIATGTAVLLAWQPNMVIETTGQVHNDPHTILVASLGLALAILGGRRLWGLRGGIILVAMSVMVKFITLPLLGVLGIIRIINRKKSDALRSILGNWLIDGVAIAAVILAAFLPFWEGRGTLDEMLREPSRLYTHPVWRTIQSLLGSLFGSGASGAWNAFSRPFLQIATIALLVGIVGWLGYRLWHAPQVESGDLNEEITPGGLPWWTRPVLYGWMGILFVLAYVPVNSHPWYWVWPVVGVAFVLAFDLRDRISEWNLRMLPTWFWVYLWGNALLTLMYHTRIARY